TGLGSPVWRYDLCIVVKRLLQIYEACQAAVMLSACLPFGPCAISNATFWPSLRVLKPFIWMDEKCAKRSSPPLSGVMNPKPLASLNHLTVPVSFSVSSGAEVADRKSVV